MLRSCGVQIKEDERDGHVARMEQLRSVLDF